MSERGHYRHCADCGDVVTTGHRHMQTVAAPVGVPEVRWVERGSLVFDGDRLLLVCPDCLLRREALR